MDRLRKWSESKHNQAPASQDSLGNGFSSNHYPISHKLPSKRYRSSENSAISLSSNIISIRAQSSSILELPSDFRTSLILPDLARRFSLLRSSTSDPVAIESLRNRFAEQRARGAENQISEEEEDMLLDTLKGFRGRINGIASRNVREAGSTSGSSLNVNPVAVIENGTASISSTGPEEEFREGLGRGTNMPERRHSHNLFGSGRPKNSVFVRTASSMRTTAGDKSCVGEEEKVHVVAMGDGGLEDINSGDEAVGDINVTLPVSSKNSSGSTKTVKLSRRASLALEQALKEMEDEVVVEDEIVMPRSSPMQKALDHGSELRDSNISSSSSTVEAGMAISSDKQTYNNLVEESSIPARILPGYIPGMPRPMTPRDYEVDDLRSHSTTPRAASSALSGFKDALTSASLSRSSTASRSSSPISVTTNGRRQAPPLSSAPFFLQRNPTGRYTPNPEERGEVVEYENTISSTISAWRRPASPLAGPTFQPMVAKNQSEPSSVYQPLAKPTNVTWSIQTSGCEPGAGVKEHHRNGNWSSEDSLSSSEFYTTNDRQLFGQRTVRSPSLFQSPESSPKSGYGTSRPTDRLQAGTKSHADGNMSVSGSELGSPAHGFRSSTPTQQNNPQRETDAESPSPFSTRNGRSSSKLRTHSASNSISSPFNFGSYTPGLYFSPMASSSRSSIESAGSSFHSWDGERDRTLALFTERDTQHPAWHEIPIFSNAKTTPMALYPDETDAEEVIQQYAGLRTADFMAIQEKLVSAANAKECMPDSRERERLPSLLRRRRPSTSQSNYSSRVTSPPPPSSPIALSATDLLKSVADSIQATRDSPKVNSSKMHVAHSSDSEVSTTTRRNRDLAQVLFGLEEPPPDEPMGNQEQEDARALGDIPAMVKPDNLLSQESTKQTPSSQILLLRNNSARIPQTSQEEAELTREVQAKTEAAMLALRGDLSTTNLTSQAGVTRAASGRKHVDRSQISTPTLLHASMSVDAIPLRSPSLSANSNAGPSKIGSRFRKLRGSLRTKNLTLANEGALPDVKSPIAVELLKHRDSLNFPSSVNTSETGRPMHLHSAFSNPGLKGFMARWLTKQRNADAPLGAEQHNSRQLSPASPLAESQTAQHSPNVSIPNSAGTDSNIPALMLSPVSSMSSAPPISPPQGSPYGATGNESDAIQQLFAAALNLGLDHGALNDLLVRSGQTPKAGDWMAKNPSAFGMPITRQDTAGMDHIEPPVQSHSNLLRRLGSEETATYRPSYTGKTEGHYSRLVVSEEQPLSRKQSARRSVDPPPRRPREGLSENATNAVIRRTIIYPSETKAVGGVDAAGVVRKFSSRRRRASANSVTTRSVHDRAPTPPPPRSPTVQRFSNDDSPPVPHLPQSMSNLENPLSYTASNGGPIEKSSSMYESLYEMYAGESRATSSAAVYDPSAPEKALYHKGDIAPEGPALELIELANGETIWSIVNGLRDHEEDYNYNNRTSIASEYSNGESQVHGMQIFVKEHGRSGSRGSITSTSHVSRRKLQGKMMRPETQVYFSPSAQIGRMIETLSQGMDAGSFNIVPARGMGHSASSSISTNDMHGTIEERLEHMLSAMRAS